MSRNIVRWGSAHRAVVLVLAAVLFASPACDNGEQVRPPAGTPASIPAADESKPITSSAPAKGPHLTTRADAVAETSQPTTLTQARPITSRPVITDATNRAAADVAQPSSSASAEPSQRDHVKQPTQQETTLLPAIGGWTITGKKFAAIKVPTPPGAQMSVSRYVLHDGSNIVARGLGILPPQGISKSGAPLAPAGPAVVSNWTESSAPIAGLHPSLGSDPKLSGGLAWDLMYPGAIIGTKLTIEPDKESKDGALVLTGEGLALLMSGGRIMAFKEDDTSQQVGFILRREESLKLLFAVPETLDSLVTSTLLQNGTPEHDLSGNPSSETQPAVVKP